MNNANLVNKTLFKCAHVNARSLVANFADIKEHIIGGNYDLVAVTETWLQHRIQNDLVDVQDYILLRRDRVTRGGGVAFYLKKTLQYQIISTTKDIENLWIYITAGKQKHAFGVIYNPPGAKHMHDQFLVNFENILSFVVPSADHIFCLGDFNIDLFNFGNSITRDFLSLINGLGLTQIINEPTRITSTTATLLDLVLVDAEELVANSGVVDLHTIDHSLVYCNLKLINTISNPTYITYRDFNRFNHQQFYEHLQSLPWRNIYDIQNINDKIEFLNSNITALLDIHAPLKTSRITKPPAPWLTDDLRGLMSVRDAALRRFKNKKP